MRQATMGYLVLPAKPARRRGPRARFAACGLAFVAWAVASVVTFAAAQEPAKDSQARPSAPQQAVSPSPSDTRPSGHGPSNQGNISVTAPVGHVPVTGPDRRGLP